MKSGWNREGVALLQGEEYLWLPSKETKYNNPLKWMISFSCLHHSSHLSTYYFMHQYCICSFNVLMCDSLTKHQSLCSPVMLLHAELSICSLWMLLSSHSALWSFCSLVMLVTQRLTTPACFYSTDFTIWHYWKQLTLPLWPITIVWNALGILAIKMIDFYI